MFAVTGMCVAIGITNQRETTIVWDSVTGRPLYNAIGSYICHYFVNLHSNLSFEYVFLLIVDIDRMFDMNFVR